VNYDNSLVVTITVTCYLWATSSGDHLFTCGAISRPPQPSWLHPGYSYGTQLNFQEAKARHLPCQG